MGYSQTTYLLVDYHFHRKVLAYGTLETVEYANTDIADDRLIVDLNIDRLPSRRRCQLYICMCSLSALPCSDPNLCFSVDDAMIVSYTHVILEVFAIYSIATSDYLWILKSRAAYLTTGRTYIGGHLFLD